MQQSQHHSVRRQGQSLVHTPHIRSQRSTAFRRKKCPPKEPGGAGSGERLAGARGSAGLQLAAVAALRAFLKFAGRRDIASLHVVERALAVPMKLFERPMLQFLTRDEMIAVLGQPGSTWTSQRDHLLLALLYNTGARVSEIIGVRVRDVVLDSAACVHLRGKGRKQRSVPLWRTTGQKIRAWLRLNPGLRDEAALLPNRDGQAMSRSNVTQRLALAVTRGSAQEPSLLKKHVSPHTVGRAV